MKIVALVFVIAFALSGCATRTILAPSTAATQSQIDRAQSNVSAAQRANSDALGSNAAAKTKAQRIEDKVQVIDRYWKN
jgi:PBP1b-binding outer membrane lipoprotein LpoB